MEIFIILLCVSQIFLYLIWLYLYSDFQDISNELVYQAHLLDVIFGGKENE